MPQKCPWCGSEEVDTKVEKEQVSAAYGPSIEVESTVNACRTCGEEGDFWNANEAALVKAKEDSTKASIPHMLDMLGEHQCSMAYIERSLALPARTLGHWKANGTTAGSVSLLRLVATFPWLLEIADHQFDASYVRGVLVREAGKAITTYLHDQNIHCAITRNNGRNRDEMNRLIDGLHDLSVAKDAAEAKLATAVEALKIIDATDDENSIAAQAMRSVANKALRALGIDPSLATTPMEKKK